MVKIKLFFYYLWVTPVPTPAYLFPKKKWRDHPFLSLKRQTINSRQQKLPTKTIYKQKMDVYAHPPPD